MEIKLSLSNFEGPLDLLLHLIKDKKIEIQSIFIYEMTEIYLNIIKEHQRNNFDVGVDYLNVAADLIYLKSKKMLPSLEEIEEEVDLITRLKEYEQYRLTKPKFLELQEERSKYSTKIPENFADFHFVNTTLSDSSFDDLISAFEKMMNRLKFQKPLETRLARQEITIESRMNFIREFLQKKECLFFSELLVDSSKELFVTSFIGMLELVKTQEIFVKQNDNFDDIFIERRVL